MELYQKGFKPSQILVKLGYRPEIIVGVSQKISNEALSDTGFLGKRDKRLLEQLSSDKQVITKLQVENAFLRQKIEFVKKNYKFGQYGRAKK